MRNWSRIEGQLRLPLFLASLVLPESEPAMLTPAQRRHQIAAILARGVLRLRQATRRSSGSRPSCTPENSSASVRNCLDASAETSPHVRTASACVGR